MTSTTILKNAICVWDITISEDKYNSPTEVISLFQKKFKKWCFQLEEGSNSGYRHYQCRVSTFKKSRNKPLLVGIHPDSITPTSNENKNNDFYCMKEETRIDGPWTDKDNEEEVYIPKQYQVKELYSWQQDLLECMKIFNDRDIYYIYNESGNIGKTTFSGYCALRHNTFILPVCNDADKLIQSCCNMLMGKNARSGITIIIDLPRALQDKSKLYGMYVAIEQIKSGRVYDMRNKYKEWWFDSPCIIIFSNNNPTDSLHILSQDRWKLKTINSKNQLRNFVGDE